MFLLFNTQGDYILALNYIYHLCLNNKQELRKKL